MARRNITRRAFIKGAAAVASVTSLTACSGLGPAIWPSRARPRYISPSEQLNIACIGCGGQGAYDIQSVSGENIVALCDVDQAHAAETFKNHPKARHFTDYRRMLDKMGDEIDAVTVSTPDHTHYAAAMMAIMMGKHVFVQKPLAHSIGEARRLTQAARKFGVATHMGIQGHAGEGARLLCEWLDAGAIGPVREVHIWTDRPIWPQGIDRPADTPPVPDTLDWNLWLGTAPERPYHPCYLPFNWRGWWDYGTGALGDIGCHAMDASFWALDLGSPTSVEAVTSPVNDETAPNWSTITYQFPARGDKPPVTLYWYDGGKMPPRPDDLEEDRDLPMGDGGQFIVGDKGTMLGGMYGDGLRIIPETRMQEFLPNRPPKTIPRSPGHYEEWLRACKGGEPAGANFDFSGPLTEMVLLGNLAVRTGQRIDWDGANMRVTNMPEANALVDPPHREF